MSNVGSTGSTGVSAMAQQLMQVFDRNKDGQLTIPEFTSVLSDLMARRTLSAAAGGSATSRTDQLTGFDPAKLDTGQSVKYQFARAAMQFDVSTVKDKASAEALLNQMRPAMQSEGLEVLDISKDRIQVMFEQQPLWIDVIQGANSGSPLFQWLPAE